MFDVNLRFPKHMELRWLDPGTMFYLLQSLRDSEFSNVLLAKRRLEYTGPIMCPRNHLSRIMPNAIWTSSLG